MDTPDESLTLISAGKVQGTPVFDADGSQTGEIYDVMLEKRTGRIAYAVMSYGGVLGLGTKYHPIPWAALKYVPETGGYVVGIPADVLRAGPGFDDNASWGKELSDKVEGHFGEWVKPA